MRTIDAPGVEIKEIDKSGYAPSMTGSKCFVMGYANKGEPYQPMEFTSKAAWQNYYGEPDNEAERYFYNACTEVINQNGVLYCSKIPYDNDAYGQMVGFNYKVSTVNYNFNTAKDYIDRNKHIIYHNYNFEHDTLQYLANNCMYRDIEDSKVTEEDKKNNKKKIDEEVQDFYNNVIEVYTNLTSQGRYSIAYYPVLSAEMVSKKCNTLENVEEFLKPYEEKGYLTTWGEVYDSSTSSRTGDYVAIAYPSEQRIAIDVNDISNYMSKALYLEGDTKWEQNVLSIFNGRSSSDELTDSDLLTILGFLNDSSNDSMKYHFHFKYDGQKSIEEYADITISKTTENAKKYDRGFNYESFIDIKLSDLYSEYSTQLVDRGYTYDKYQNIYFQSKNKTFKELAYKSYDIILDPLTKAYKVSAQNFDNLLYMCDFYKDNENIKVKDLYDKYGCVEELVKKSVKYYQAREVDNSLDTYFEITPGGEPINYDLTTIDEYRTGEAKFTANQFLIVDKTCATLKSIPEDSRKGSERQMIGIFPVVTTPINALYAQNLIHVDDEDVPDFETVTGILTKDDNQVLSVGHSLISSDIVKQFSNKEIVASKAFEDGEQGLIETVSREANQYFSTIQMNSTQTGFDTENLKKIGIVVFKAYLDASEGNKVNFTPVESFVGSLDKDAKNPTTGATTFIDTIVNSQSDYIYCFSNCFIAKTTKALLKETDTFLMKPGVVGMLGFYDYETKEELSLPTLYQGIDQCLQKVEDINERDIDIIPDAGLANIAQYLYAMKSYWGTRIPYDIDACNDDGNPMVKYWTCSKTEDVGAWKTVLQKLDQFCKNVRKDCMFIADGPRPMVLQGQKKIVRPSKPSNTIDANILPYVKWATGLNTNYGAGYLDWFEVADEFTGDNFWCPPSIKAMGVYINTDVNYNYWDAPAGLNRGVIAALDTAFSPTIKQAGSIYTKNWNYAINYPYDGIVLEGQKTFQVKPSAFDRVNVRRLFLRLERQTYKVARYFVYEGNTAYTRQRLVDTLDPIFYQAKVGGGIYDYKIICDESINTASVIDNNELKVKIGIKPVKTAEFILIDFVALSTGGSFSEM